MVAQDFFDLLKKLHPKKGGGIEDFSDRFNYHFTVMMLILCSTVVTVKQYVFKPITCYVATPHAGANLMTYLENYCWIEGTNPLDVNGQIPINHKEWNDVNHNNIYYYQWIPFVLGLQAILFYAPRTIWQVITANGSGTNLAHVMTLASDANRKQEAEREKIIKHVAKSIEQNLIHYREYRQGPLSNLRRSCHRFCFGCVISKRLGTWLVLWYIFIKLLYFINSFGQIYLMQTFLGLNSEYNFFGYDILKNVLTGRTWEQTKIFPRVTFCRVPIKLVGFTSSAVAQCVLPVNMLNEKIYIFLWFWIVFDSIVTGLSVPLWLLRLSFTKHNARFIRKYLKLTEVYYPKEKLLVNRFASNFLRHDGMFLLRMLSINAGDLVTSDIVMQLWSTFRDRFKHRDLRDDGIDEVHKNTIKLSQSQTDSGICHPTAPIEIEAPTYDEYKKYLQMQV